MGRGLHSAVIEQLFCMERIQGSIPSNCKVGMFKTLESQHQQYQARWIQGLTQYKALPLSLLFVFFFLKT